MGKLDDLRRLREKRMAGGARKRPAQAVEPVVASGGGIDGDEVAAALALLRRRRDYMRGYMRKRRAKL